MMFNVSVSALAENRNVVEGYARALNVDYVHAQSAMRAFASGLYFPTYEQMRAISRSDSFLKEWRNALYSYHVLELERLHGAKIYEIAKPETFRAWVLGRAGISTQKLKAIKETFGVDMDEVPVSRRFVYVAKPGPVLTLDMRRTALEIDGDVYRFHEFAPGACVYLATSQEALDALRNRLLACGVQLIDEGRLHRLDLTGTLTAVIGSNVPPVALYVA
ncbi:hypothetical protein LU11_gp310 [Pseudomonas phage Lu11]|uniref:hypothetical protein n=1 Tax=Pseudomonas phage Lu11 TaxID=1161927 RepID=UPI00025F1860|nr:hypothetical protein LU11_gp310 [Pseudomonas phage Lu11]AFH14841.1 hypothetical protein Lu11_0303 [Pseudomonas phage Lu11]